LEIFLHKAIKADSFNKSDELQKALLIICDMVTVLRYEISSTRGIHGSYWGYFLWTSKPFLEQLLIRSQIWPSSPKIYYLPI